MEKLRVVGGRGAVFEVPGRLDELIIRVERGMTTKDDANFLRNIRASLTTATIRNRGSNEPCAET